MPRTILVVDDERALTEVLADVLSFEGYAVRRAFDGEEALREVARAPVDLILTDVMMPRVNGFALINRLRNAGDTTPIVLMSAVVAGVDIPGVRFLPKPFDLDHLVQVIARVIEEVAL